MHVAGNLNPEGRRKPSEITRTFGRRGPRAKARSSSPCSYNFATEPQKSPKITHSSSSCPKIRPRVKFDFRRFAVDKKEQTYESKTETTQCGLQGQSGIRSPGGAQNGRA